MVASGGLRKVAASRNPPSHSDYEFCFLRFIFPIRAVMIASMRPLARKHFVLATLLWSACAFGADSKAPLVFESMPMARFDCTGPIGERVTANLENWLLRAPQSNPGMIEMFRLRDRKPAPDLVPWAGEFVGKFLISAIQGLRLSDDARVRRQVAGLVSEFIATQAEDGYLGPFQKKERLLGHWDLWGHYHAIIALAMWHEYTGDASALAAARKAADLVCATYLETGRRVIDAGDPEMNMSILTAMALLHRLTGEPRYLRMAREVEKDWERAGDYLRAGLDGREFFRSPRPRWESLNDLQGLLELWRIRATSVIAKRSSIIGAVFGAGIGATRAVSVRVNRRPAILTRPPPSKRVARLPGWP
jgi:hypothetical protein